MRLFVVPVLLCALAALGAAPLAAQHPDSTGGPPVQREASSDTSVHVTFGGFVDGYYAWDANRPRDFDRAYTTTAARHADFDVNLAFVDAKLASDRVHGRLALQYGTSVQVNYATEPRVGSNSPSSAVEYLQEAYAGYRVAPGLWVDGGIFFAHTGYETFISRDNLLYTRSLMADASPYYEAGVRLMWSPDGRLTAQLDVVNGWQNVTSYNSSPAAGIRLDFAATPRLTLSYDDFVGNMAPDSAATQIRTFHEGIVQYNSAAWSLAAALDVGTQAHAARDGGTASWSGAEAIAKYHVTPALAVAARAERLSDPEQVVVTTGLPDALAATGGSLAVDVTSRSRLLWRTEMRGLRGAGRVFPARGERAFVRDDVVAVTSLALSF